MTKRVWSLEMATMAAAARRRFLQIPETRRVKVMFVPFKKWTPAFRSAARSAGWKRRCRTAAAAPRRRFWRCSKVFSLVIACVVCASASALDLKTLDGRVYRNVKVIMPEADGLAVITEDGSKVKIYFQSLPRVIREKYHYDPTKAQKLRDKLKWERERERRRRESDQKRWLARYRHIRDEGEPHVVVKKITLAPKGGGFIYLKERSVVSVFHEKLALQSEIFSAPMERLEPLSAYLNELDAGIDALENSIRSYPERFKALNDELQRTHVDLATLLGTATTYQRQIVFDQNGVVVGTRQTSRLDPVVASRVTDLKRQIRDLRGRISDMEKNGVDKIAERLLELRERRAEVAVNAGPFLDEERRRKVDSSGGAAEIDEELRRKLALLREMLKDGLLDEEEYERKRSRLLVPAE